MTTSRPVYQHITVYEEVGHGGSASVPEGVTDILSVDMGCVGDGLECKEHQVSICVKDSVRAIGLSNFTPEQVQEILDICEVKPAVLQTEVHPYSQEKELKAFLDKEGIVIQAWYPLGHGDKALIQEPLFTEFGKKYGKSNAQIILRWHIQAGNIVIPGSKNPAHIKDNFNLFDFALTDDEMAKITALDKQKRYYTSTPEMLKKYAEMVPPVDEQKKGGIRNA